MNRQRDLDTVKLSDECRRDIARLIEIADEVDRLKPLYDERRIIIARRLKKGDLYQAEIARIARVSQPVVAGTVEPEKVKKAKKNLKALENKGS